MVDQAVFLFPDPKHRRRLEHPWPQRSLAIKAEAVLREEILRGFDLFQRGFRPPALQKFPGEAPAPKRTSSPDRSPSRVSFWPAAAARRFCIHPGRGRLNCGFCEVSRSSGECSQACALADGIVTTALVAPPKDRLVATTPAWSAFEFQKRLRG